MPAYPHSARVPAQRTSPTPGWERSRAPIAPVPTGPVPDDDPLFALDHARGGARTLSYAASAGALPDPAAQIAAFLRQARRTAHTY